MTHRFLTVVFSLILFLLPFSLSSGQSVGELESKIEQQRLQIERIESEIRLQQQKVYEAQGEKQTVQSAINKLNAEKNKILSDVSETQSQIEKSNLTIQKIDLEIADKESNIDTKRALIAENLVLLQNLEQTSLIEVMLTYDSIADFWTQIAERQSFSAGIHQVVQELHGVKEELSDKQKEEEEEKKELEQFKIELKSEQEAVESTKKQKNELLKVAKNKELTYQQILDQKVAQKKAFEQALNSFESQLQIILDKSAFAAAKNGVLGWPIERRPIVITQNFGGTQFAKSNPHVYGRPFHNGTDIDLQTGDKVIAPLSGIIRETGNTDAFPGCYSWGKWVLIQHPNGLSSLFAHLSAISVTKGQSVATGQQIGLGGNTGFSTGSHLHYTLYATQGVQIKNFEEFKASTGCSGAKTPVAAHDAYLDPRKYLPSL